MWPLHEEMQTFQALSYGDMWRVRGFLARGEAPSDPRLATAAVELAESYQRQSKVSAALIRWAPAAAIVAFGSGTVFAATGGNALQAILFAVIAVANGAHVIFNPATRPKNVVRSLEASKRVVASSG